MKVYIVQTEHGEDLHVFATRELAVAFVEPDIRALWDEVINPAVDMPGGWGGSSWRARTWAARGWDRFLAERLSLEIEEHDVIGGASGVRDAAAADVLGEALG